jgi:hypothetical protein
MANITIIGFVDNIKYLPNQGGCFVFVSEFKKGYKKSNGEVVDDKYLSWKVIFKQGLVKYINNHFNNGMLVEIKGEVFPYAIDKETIVQGYSVIGQCMNLASYPRSTVKMEQNLVKESLLHGSEIPNIDEYKKPDF